MLPCSLAVFLQNLLHCLVVTSPKQRQCAQRLKPPRLLFETRVSNNITVRLMHIPTIIV